MSFVALTDWQDQLSTSSTVIPRKPRILSKEQWPPDYEAVWAWRTRTLKRLKDDPALQQAAREYYSTRPHEFIMDWCDTYDPRRAGSKWIPFIFFTRQGELLDFLQSLTIEQQGGLIEKCRDMGATWLAVAWCVWRFLFIEGDAVGWGSRKQDLVDKLGDTDSIFEKARQLLRRIPPFFLPTGFNAKKNVTFMKLINPTNGASMTGEAGDNIGRGGRKSVFIKDESAHYERPELIEAALGDNTNVQIDLSSVNGLGNVFHRRRENGVIWYPGAELPKGYTRVFIMDWRDHPNKTQAWYDERKARHEREGMMHIFAQEVDRDYSAAVTNTIIPYSHTRSAIDAHLKVPYIREAYEALKGAQWIAGLDVADGGTDRNALALREWIIWRECYEWGERDPGTTARRAIDICRPHRGRIQVMYDSIGVGSGVKTEYNRLTQDENIINASELPFVPWNAGAAVRQPYDRIIPGDDESLRNGEYYMNLKAQAWGELARRFYKTHKAVTEGIVYPVDELISLDGRMPLIEQLCKELAQPTRGQSGTLKMLVDKKPDGTKSPNLADGGVMMYYPIPYDQSNILVGQYGH